MGMGMGMGGAGDDLAGARIRNLGQFGRELNKYKSKECSSFFVARTVNSKDEAEVCILPRPELGMGMGMGMGGARCGLYLPKHQRRRKRPGRRGPKGKAPIRFIDKRKVTNYQGVQYSFNTAIQGGYEVKMKKGPKGKAPKGKAPIPPQPTNPHPLR